MMKLILSITCINPDIVPNIAKDSLHYIIIEDKK